MSGTKETTELLRAASALIVEGITDMRDGKFDFKDKFKMALLIPSVMRGIKGFSAIPDELRDIQQSEHDALVNEIEETLARLGFTHRTRDVAKRVLDLAYLNVCEIADILRIPVAAELVKD